MDPLVISAIVTVVGGIVGAILNHKSVSDTNEQNKELTHEAWARDDSALQRSKADAQAAGFSPLAALGTPAGNSAPLQMQAPHIDTSFMGKAGDQLLSGYQAKTQRKLADAQVTKSDEETKGLKLDNQLKSATLTSNIAKNVTELIKMKRENDISQAEFVALLQNMKADGLSNEMVDTIIKNSADEGHYSSSDISPSAMTTNELAQLSSTTGLNNALKELNGYLKSDVYPSEKSLVDVQKKLADYEEAIAGIDSRYYSTAPGADFYLEYPVITDGDKLEWKRITGDSKTSRREIYQKVADKYEQFYATISHISATPSTHQRIMDWIGAVNETANTVFEGVNTFTGRPQINVNTPGSGRSYNRRSYNRRR